MRRLRIYRQIALLIVSAVISATSQAESDQLTQDLINLSRQQLPSASVGFCLIDANTGKVISEHHAKKLFSPASNAKLFVGAAALYELLDEFVYKTSLFADAKQVHPHRISGDVVIKFSGDPSLTRDDILLLFQQLKAQGIKQIKGDLLIDDSEFIEPSLPNGYSLDDIAWYYAAPVDSIIIDANRVKLAITAGESVGDSIQVKPYPQDRWVSVDQQVKTVTHAYAEKHCELRAEVDQTNAIHLSGCWSIDKKVGEKGIAIANPYQRAMQLIQQALKSEHIHLTGRIKRGSVKPEMVTLTEHQSAPIAELVKYLMKESDNLTADAIFKTLGKTMHDQGSYINGANAVEAILRKNTKLDINAVAITDGSGSRYNLISPKAITDLLYSVYHSDKIKQAFMETLPVAQQDGTLAWRFAEKNIPGKLIAKTGTMQDISALSGYMFSRSDHPYVFSIIINHVLGEIKQAKRVEEQLALLMLEYLE